MVTVTVTTIYVVIRITQDVSVSPIKGSGGVTSSSDQNQATKDVTGASIATSSRPTRSSGKGGGKSKGGAKKQTNHSTPAVQAGNQTYSADGKTVKTYLLKYAKYLQCKPVTKSPFDTLIAAAQVEIIVLCRSRSSLVDSSANWSAKELRATN